MVLLGGGFRLQGLNKYLQQTTQLQTVRPDAFDKLAAGPEVSSAKLHDNICDFGIVYGLGLQALGYAKIESNLLPGRIARSMAWARKSRMFLIAASVLCLVSLFAFLKTNLDKQAYHSKDAQSYRSRISSVIQQARGAAGKLRKEEGRDSGYKELIDKQVALFKHRNLIPLLNEMLIECLPNAKNNSAQARLYQAFEQADVEKIEEIPRKERKQVFITSLGVSYSESLLTAPLDVSKPATISRSRRSTGEAAGGMPAWIWGWGCREWECLAAGRYLLRLQGKKGLHPKRQGHTEGGRHSG